jgi:hypothetical protein
LESASQFCAGVEKQLSLALTYGSNFLRSNMPPQNDFDELENGPGKRAVLAVCDLAARIQAIRLILDTKFPLTAEGKLESILNILDAPARV